jgi:hypothetical protein
MRTRLLGGALTLAIFGCGTAAPPDAGPSLATLEYSFKLSPAAKVMLVVVVDDRTTAEASELREGLAAATRRLAWDLVPDAASDMATWNAVDLRVLLVGASAGQEAAVRSWVDDASLAWTTPHATAEGAEALGRAVGERASQLTASEGARFEPLARARDVLALLRGARPARGPIEERVAAVATTETWTIGVSVLASVDDESTEPATAYRIASEPMDEIGVGLVTGGSLVGPRDAARWPRLSAWAEDSLHPLASVCRADVQAPFDLFPISCADFVPRCLSTLEQVSPDSTACSVEVTTFERECLPARGWVDPMGVDGVRRPRRAQSGELVCEALPVSEANLDACVHDAACTDCGSGWCIGAPHVDSSCPAGLMPLPLRWVGAVLPNGGTVHVACREKDVR